MAELEATVPGVTESAERLHRCLSKLFSILRRGDPSGSAAGAELTLAQLSILVTLLDQGPIRMTDLAAHERVRTPTTTVAIRAPAPRQPATSPWPNFRFWSRCSIVARSG